MRACRAAGERWWSGVRVRSGAPSRIFLLTRARPRYRGNWQRLVRCLHNTDSLSSPDSETVQQLKLFAWPLHRGAGTDNAQQILQLAEQPTEESGISEDDSKWLLSTIAVALKESAVTNDNGARAVGQTPVSGAVLGVYRTVFWLAGVGGNQMGCGKRCEVCQHWWPTQKDRGRIHNRIEGARKLYNQGRAGVPVDKWWSTLYQRHRRT